MRVQRSGRTSRPTRGRRVGNAGGGGGGGDLLVGVGAGLAAAGGGDFAYPDGKASGDLAVLCLARGGANALTGPSGFTAVASGGNRCWMWYRVLDGSEGATVSATVMSQVLAGAILVFRGLEAAPLDVADIQAVVSTPNPILPAITPTTTSSLVVQAHGGENSTNGAIDTHEANDPVVLDQIGAVGASIQISYFYTSTTSVIAQETLDELALNNFYQGIRAAFKVAA